MKHLARKLVGRRRHCKFGPGIALPGCPAQPQTVQSSALRSPVDGQVPSSPVLAITCARRPPISVHVPSAERRDHTSDHPIAIPIDHRSPFKTNSSFPLPAKSHCRGRDKTFTYQLSFEHKRECVYRFSFQPLELCLFATKRGGSSLTEPYSVICRSRVQRAQAVS